MDRQGLVQRVLRLWSKPTEGAIVAPTEHADPLRPPRRAGLACHMSCARAGHGPTPRQESCRWMPALPRLPRPHARVCRKESKKVSQPCTGPVASCATLSVRPACLNHRTEIKGRIKDSIEEKRCQEPMVSVPGTNGTSMNGVDRRRIRTYVDSVTEK